ncbi:hypothetical protein [Lichenicola sp.]|uniref:hypothetical protein n=1 Tax=Lichenicola sp. TaxID=2804529 RepID=UPI003B00DA9C
MPFDPLHQPDATMQVDGVVMVRDQDRLRTLRLGGQAVRHFAPGWRAGALSRLLQPLLLLEFHAATGESGLWMLDEAFEHLRPNLDSLPPEQLHIVLDTIRPVLDWLRDGRLGDGQPEPVSAFLSLQPSLRRTLEQMCLAAPDAPDPARLPLEQRLADTAPAPPPDDHTLPVHARDGRFMIGATGLIVLQGGAPAVLHPGWQPLRICTLAFPVLILELSHESGAAAVWYLDHRGEFIGHQATTLHPAARTQLARVIRPLFAQLWRSLLLHPDEPVDARLIRFLALHEVIKLDLMALMLESRTEAGIPHPTQVWTLTEPLPRNLGYVIPTGTGQVAIDPEHARAACLQPLQENFIEMLLQGETSWPSPVDGQKVRTILRPLYYDNLCFAYQLHDARHDLTFHIVALEWHFRTFGIYFPSIDLLVAADAASATRTRHYCLDFVAMMQRHLLVYGQSIAIGNARIKAHAPSPAGPLVQAFRGEPTLHIGHYLWQDLTGLDALVARVPAGKLPPCLVFDSHLAAEMYGPIDRIHPELEGRVIRRPSPFEHSIRTFYETGTRVMKITGMVVTRSVGAHVMAAIDTDPRWDGERAEMAAIAPGTPVILLGLRVGNRTLEDQAGVFGRLVEDLVTAFAPKLPVIVLDGHNSSAEGATYRSVADDRPGATPFIDAERAIAAALAETCAARGVRLVDTIGRPVPVSLIWCRRAGFFVAPWGAALAKYRWICNTPGLVMTGHWNLVQRGDLDLYHNPAVLEAPSELVFLPADHVQDIMVPGEAPDRANFRVDEAALFGLVRRFALNHA